MCNMQVCEVHLCAPAERSAVHAQISHPPGGGPAQVSPSCSASVPRSMQVQGTSLSVLIPGASPWTTWAPRGLGHLFGA